jgi:DNA-binding CsgD family transcriptional regulator
MICVTATASFADSYRRPPGLDDVLEHRGRAQHASGALRAPRELVLPDQLVEAGEVFVQSEHVRNDLRQLSIGTAFDPELSVVLGDAHRSRAVRDRQRRLETSSREVDVVGRQLGDAVRDDRPREVDRLTAGAAEWKVSDPSQSIRVRQRSGQGNTSRVWDNTSTRVDMGLQGWFRCGGLLPIGPRQLRRLKRAWARMSHLLRRMGLEVIGRTDEIQRLLAYFEQPTGSSAFVLEGAPGIGKSTLWLAGVNAAQERGLQVLSSRPAEAERELVYAGLGDLLEGVFDRIRPTLPPPRGRALEAALLLEVGDSSQGPDARTVAVAVRSALEVLAADGPLVVAIDDVQWLDSSSESALAFAIRRLHEQPVALLLARRVGHGVQPSELERAVEPERVQRLRVGPLSLGLVQRLLQARVGHTFGRLLLVRIHEASAGNPFYALELGRALDTSIDLTQPLPIPETLEGLLRRRLDGLPRPTRDALALVTALGNPSSEILERAGVEREVLEPAFAAHVIEHDDNRVRFTHPLLASVLYQGLGAGERRCVHRVLAQVVDEPINRARHLALASDGPDADVAAVLEEAGSDASLSGLPIVASELVELARRLTPLVDREARHRRAIVAAHARLTAGDVGGARARVHELVASTPEGPARAEALVLLSSAEAIGAGDIEHAIALRREALREAAEHPALQASIHQWLASNVRDTEGVRSGERHARMSLALAEKLGDDALRAGALAVLALLRFNGGEPDAPELAERAHQLAVDVANRQKRPASVAHLLAWSVSGLDRVASLGVAHVLVWSARLDTARALLGPLLRELRERDELGSAELLWYLSLVELQAGRLELAADYMARAREIRLLYTLDEREDPDTLSVLARIAIHRGELELARQFVERGRNATEPRSRELAPFDAILGTADLWSGAAAMALTRFAAAEQATRSAEVGEPNMYWWRADLAEALLQVGRVDDAVELLDAWEIDARRVGRGWVLAQVTRCRGLVAASRGDVDQALVLLERAVAQHEAVGDPFGRARALLALGVVRRRARQKRAARDAIEAGLAGFETIGAADWAAKARAERGRIGGRTRSVGLTPAERRVAELVAKGRTNREVAEALVLGERTVETHLTHIYSKLGVRSRTELTRTLGQAS